MEKLFFRRVRSRIVRDGESEANKNLVVAFIFLALGREEVADFEANELMKKENLKKWRNTYASIRCQNLENDIFFLNLRFSKKSGF